MATKKKYQGFLTDIEAFDGTKYPDVKSPIFRTVKQVWCWLYNYDLFTDKSCGGSASMFHRRIK